ncbi:MAG: PH domain-containing protein [Candidatus Bathyarchaeota archaeon]|nr:PH domain-containing protein [Candidatus Bathyarchaeota archaeon]
MYFDKHGSVVWVSKPWIAPEAIVRTFFVGLIAVLVFWFEFSYNIGFSQFAGLTLFDLTLLFFITVWLIGIVQLVISWASNTYILRQDELEVRQGILAARSFTVNAKTFGELTIYQSIGGWLFGYGDLIVTCKGQPETKLSLLRSPFLTASTLRQVMGKPLVKMNSHIDK